MRTELFMYYELHRDQGWIKTIFNPPPPGSLCYWPFNAVVPVLFLILCSFVVYTTERLVFKSLFVLFVLVSPFVLAFWSPLLGKRELVFVLLVHLFVCFARVCFCPFSLQGWLRFVMWLTLDLSINFFHCVRSDISNQRPFGGSFGTRGDQWPSSH